MVSLSRVFRSRSKKTEEELEVLQRLLFGRPEEDSEACGETTFNSTGVEARFSSCSCFARAASTRVMSWFEQQESAGEDGREVARGAGAFFMGLVHIIAGPDGETGKV
jgi:hypothetical protein